MSRNSLQSVWASLPPEDEGAGQHHHQGPWLLQTGRYQGEIEARGTE